MSKKKTATENQYGTVTEADTQINQLSSCPCAWQPMVRTLSRYAYMYVYTHVVLKIRWGAIGIGT